MASNYRLGEELIGTPKLPSVLGPLTASYGISARPGATIAAVTGLASGEFIEQITPNDGRVQASADGTSLIVGDMARVVAPQPGTLKYRVWTSSGRQFEVEISASESMGGGGSSNAALLAAMPANPLIGILGASRYRQGVGIGTSGRVITSMSMSWVPIMRANNPAFKFEVWDDNTASQNAAEMNGMCFANDGENFDQMAARNAKIIAAAGVKLVIVNSALGFVQFGVTPSTYLAAFRSVVDPLIAAGIAVVVDNLWERNTLAGGVWVSGTAERLMIPSINSFCKTTWDALGVPVIDFRSAMIDFTDPDRNPLAAVVRSDGTHESAIGGEIMADAAMAVLSTILPTVASPAILAGNVSANPLMTGTAGTVAGTGIAGILASNMTSRRVTNSLSASAVTLRKVSKVPANVKMGTDGKDWQEIEFDPANVASGTNEGVAIDFNNMPTLTVNKWYVAQVMLEWDAHPALKEICLNFNDAGGATAKSATAFRAINNGGGPVFGVDAAMMTLRNAAVSRLYRTYPFKAGTTGAGVANLEVVYGQSATIGKVRFTQVQFFEYEGANNDPTQIMYDVNDTAAPTITSANSGNAIENAVFTGQLTSNKKIVEWGVTGPDAALVSLNTKTGAWTAGPFDYDASPPQDANGDNILSVTWSAKQANPNAAAGTQSYSLNILNEDDGITYTYTGFTDGTDLADAYPSGPLMIERIGGVSGALIVSSSRLTNQSAPARTLYRVPQQGDTDKLQVQWKVTTTSPGPRIALRAVDQDNGLWLTQGANAIALQKMVAGALTTIANFATPVNLAVGQIAMGQILSDNICRVWLNGGPVGTFDLTGYAGNFDGVKRQGKYNSNGGSSNHMDDVNFRVAAPVTNPKVWLKVLTGSARTATAGVAYADNISANRTSGGTIALQNIKKDGVTITDGSIIADGDFIRGASPAAGTWTWDVVEAHSNAANTGQARTTSFSTVFS